MSYRSCKGMPIIATKRRLTTDFIRSNSEIQVQQLMIAVSTIAFSNINGKHILNGFIITSSACAFGTAGTVAAAPTLGGTSYDSAISFSSAAPVVIISGNISSSGTTEIAAPPILASLGTFVARCLQPAGESIVRRSTLSLLEHLRTQHCNISSTWDEEITLTPLSTTKPTLSATRTAVAEREFRKTLQSDFLPPTADATREGPVTKHVRLTAALILQNLATYSSIARRQLSGYELLLCDLALSGGKASNVLVKCLAVLATELSASDVTGNSSRNLR
ncbi:hypothetical protein Aperf_G00000015711 [Anoplocephala perfoliata]